MTELLGRGKRWIAVALALILVVAGVLFPGKTSFSDMSTSSPQATYEADTDTDMDTGSDTVTISREDYERLIRYSSLDDLSQIVEQYYYEEPDLDAMLDGAKRGLLAGLGDPYTYYYSPDDYAQMQEDDKGEYAGIGIQIAASYVTMFCTITRVFNESPALQSGLQKGDILAKVDDLDVTAETLNDAVSIMRGEVGKTVRVQVLRDGKLLDFVIPRAVVHVNWVSSCMLDEKVGYIQLFDFAGDCFNRFQEQLNTLIKQGAQALIIDLRDNPGGWVDDAIHLADLFMPKETITYLQYRDGEREYYTATDGALSLPMVVLMNENSASASEILAGAFQDYGLATIVGTQSFGKGIVQFVIPVGNDGAAMQLTAAYYYTPKGRSVHKVGITPDVEVSLPKDDHTLYELGDMTDPQLKKAYEVALQKRSGTFVAPVPTASPTANPTEQIGADTGTVATETTQTEEKLLHRVS